VTLAHYDIKKVYEAVKSIKDNPVRVSDYKTAIDMLSMARAMLGRCRRNYPFANGMGLDYYVALYQLLTVDGNPFCRNIMRGRCDSCQVYGVCWRSVGPGVSMHDANLTTPHIISTRLSIMATAIGKAQIEREKALLRKSLGNYRGLLSALDKVSAEANMTNMGRVAKPKHALTNNQLAGMASAQNLLRCFATGHSTDEQYLLERTYSALHALYVYYFALSKVPLSAEYGREIPMYELPLCSKYREDGAVPCEGCSLSVTSITDEGVLISDCLESVWATFSGTVEPATRRDMLENLLLIIKDLVNG